eukprot:6204033-Pleurochrysis_carterae.AAC.2
MCPGRLVADWNLHALRDPPGKSDAYHAYGRVIRMPPSTHFPSIMSCTSHLHCTFTMLCEDRVLLLSEGRAGRCSDRRALQAAFGELAPIRSRGTVDSTDLHHRDADSCKRDCVGRSTHAAVALAAGACHDRAAGSSGALDDNDGDDRRAGGGGAAHRLPQDAVPGETLLRTRSRGVLAQRF